MRHGDILNAVVVPFRRTLSIVALINLQGALALALAPVPELFA